MDSKLEDKSLCILIAEDDPVQRDVLEELLCALGHQVIPSTNGKHAIEQFQNTPCDIDLLITDICMPEVNGAELIAHIRSHTSHLPIFAVTGYADHHLLEDVIRQGIPIFEKPIAFHALEAALKSLQA